MRALREGVSRHARATIEQARQEAERDAQEASRLLDEAYRSHERGAEDEDVLEAFLDGLESWLTPRGARRVDVVFDRIELDRAPESLGLLLLATTRRTRHHFSHRAPFIERLAVFLIGRAGRTLTQVEAMLQGLRE